jgi:4-hydroxy-4-methyl-2-oxoglutarate aldolase
MFPEFPPVVGYAATARIHTSNPPMEGNSFHDRTDWWNHIVRIPAPRMVVVEDVDNPPGLGSFIGKVHGNILYALGCVGVVTNGAVRGLRAAQAIGLQIFAGNLSASHAYAHIFDFGGPVSVAGMRVQPGDLLHGDVHGVQTIPLEIADRIPERAKEMTQNDEQIIALCRSQEFTLEKIRAAVKNLKP